MKPSMRSLFFLIAFFTILFMAFTPVLGRQSATTSQDIGKLQPRLISTQFGGDVYLVDVIVLNLFNIDLNAGTYSMDFYLMLTCQDAPCENEPRWDIMNSTSGVDVQDQGASQPFIYYEYRVKANMIGRVDYTFYPFDYLYVDIFIEDKESSSEQLTYEFSGISVDPYLFNPSGWYHDPAKDYGNTYVIDYGSAETTFDRLDIWLFLERDWLGAFMKTVFPAIVIVLVGMLSYLMKSEATTERLALTSSTLVAIVLYHISLVAGVPATGYLTFIDKFMVWTYVIVFLSLLVSVVMMVYMNAGKKETAEKLHLWTRWVIPSLWVGIMVFVFVTELTVPYNVLVSAAEGVYTWSPNLGWLARLLDVYQYFPEGYFIS